MLDTSQDNRGYTASRHVLEDYAELSDETLIKLIAQAKADALSELYNRYCRLVFGLALNIVKEQATAEEITLDVFTRIWERAETYEVDQARVKTWLTSITRYRAIDVLRRRNVRPEGNSIAWADVSMDHLPRTADTAEVTELALQRERVRLAVAELPQNQKEVLSLAYFRGYSHRQIAEFLDQPLGTVKTRIRLAIQKLRRALQDEQIAP